MTGNRNHSVNILSSIFHMRLFIAGIVLCSALISAAAEQRRFPLQLHVTGLRSDKGIVGVLVFQSRNGFPDSRKLAMMETGSRPENGKAVIRMELPRGQYALAVVHDENENHRMDWKMMMIPAEGFGFSRNPVVSTGAPAFDDARIAVPVESPGDAIIRLKYM